MNDDDDDDDRPRPWRKGRARDDDRGRDDRKRDDRDSDDRDSDDRDSDDRDSDEEDYRPPRRRRRYDDDDVGSDLPKGLLPSSNTSILAIIAGYLGIFSLLCFPAPFALILGILALIQLRRNPKLQGYSRAIVGIVMGGLVMLGVIVLIIIGAIGKH